MAGIYIHIPFCKQACNYCNFYFSLSLKRKNEFITTLLCELKQRKHYLGNEPIETIYLGGGTPSLLTYDDLQLLFEGIYETYPTSKPSEITLEANPDDLDAKKINELYSCGINRLSIGVQSFHDVDLQYMNRLHSGQQALSAIYRSQDKGISNISIDLIYGTPTMDEKAWKKNIETSIHTHVPHISAYALTVEPKTKLESLIKKRMMLAPLDEQSALQFDLLQHELEQASFIAYEISNYAKEGYESKHNSNYWNGTHYIGLGPSAHSYNGHERQWNVRNTIQYIKQVQEGVNYYEKEALRRCDHINEYIMTSLRTKNGLALDRLNTIAGKNIWQHIESSLVHINPQYYHIDSKRIYTSKAGKFMADGIASSLFIDEEELDLL